MKKLILLKLIFFFTLSAHAQQLEWMKTTSGGDIHYFDRNVSFTDWLSTADEEGNGIFAGHYSGSIQVSPNKTLYTPRGNVFITKVAPDGNAIWAIQPQLGYNIISRISKLITDSEGNVYLSGFFIDSLRFGSKTVYADKSITNLVQGYTRWHSGFIAKFSPTGTCLFIKTITLGDDYTAGGDFGYRRELPITTDPEGNFYVCASFDVPRVKFENHLFTTRDTDTSAFYLAKYKPDGTLLFAKEYKTDGLYGNTYVADIKTDVQGNIYSTGLAEGFIKSNTNSFPLNYYGAYFLKMDGLGNILWVRNAQTLHRFTFSPRIAVDNNGDVIASGFFAGQLVIGQDTLVSQKIVIHNNVTDTVHFEDIYMVKYTTSGQQLWLKHISSEDQDYPWGLDTDKEGNIYISGSFYSSITLDSITMSNPPANPYTYTSNAYLARLSPSGKVEWARLLTGETIDSLYYPGSPERTNRNVIGNISYSPAGSLYFWGTATKNATWSGAPIAGTTSHKHHLYMARVSVPGSGPGSATDISIYPNPASEQLTIHLPDIGAQQVSCNFYNTIGQIVRKETLPATNGKVKYHVPLQHMSNGMYILEVQAGALHKTQRLMIAR